MSRSIVGILALTLVASISCAAELSTKGVSDPPVGQFLRTHCQECHQGSDPEGGLDLTKLGRDLASDEVQKRWIRIFDRVHDGEMPPPDATQPPKKDVATFLQATGDWLRTYQRSQDETLGRVRARRLTRREIERSLQDLLGIDIPLADQLPEESRSAGFTTVADGQSMSHFQLERHLAVVDVALDEAFRRALSPEDQYDRTFEARDVARSNERKRCREPEMLDGQAVTWSSGLIFYGRLPVTAAPADGWYRFKVRVSGLKLPSTGGVWTTVRVGLCVSSAPLLSWVTAFEAFAEPRDIEFEAWLPKGQMLEIRPGDVTLRKARFEGGQVGVGEGDPQDVPGIAIDEITMTRIHRNDRMTDNSNDELRRRMLGGLSVKPTKKGKHLELAQKVSPNEAVKLLETFARRAFRYPATSQELAGYSAMVRQALAEGSDVPTALRAGYRAVLCSPRFLYLTESPGKLNDHAIAARLSYFLTGSTPDERLIELADACRLHTPETIRTEVTRLLKGAGGRRFVED
ncbi:MAG TPA: DUF1587 domain-containing protein, partial [Pirellulales bacterium]|nr:DUF1587 domain-containing protein [Pirellulales bacterium]